MPLYRLPAVVLHTRPFQDAHQLVSMLSPAKGKIRALAKGSRRVKSGLGRLTQPMVYAIFQLAEGKNLDSITQGSLLSAFPKIRMRLEPLAHALYALELINRLVEEPEPNPPLFFLLVKTLEQLEEGGNPAALLRVFESHLFRFLGYAPEVEHCLICRKTPPDGKFSIRLGGILCAACAAREDSLAVPLRRETQEGLQQVLASAPGNIPDVSPKALQEIGELFQRYLKDKCEKTLYGFQFLETIRRS